MNILSFSRKQKLLLTAIFGILLLLVLFAGYVISTSLFSFQDEIQTQIFADTWPMSVVIILLLIMLVLVLIYRIIFIWSYSIQFQDTFLEVRMARIPFAQTFKCAYADISAVLTPTQNFIEIVPREGKSLRFIPASFEGGEERVFRLLSQYISSDRFETGLRDGYKRVSRSTQIFNAVMFFLMTCYLFLLVVQAPYSVIPLPLSWNYFGPWTLFGDFVSGFSVESPDSVWIASRSYFPTRFVIQHVFAGKTEAWYPPTGKFHNLQNLVLVSARQQPVLITDNAVYFMKNEQWEMVNYQPGYRYDFSRNGSVLRADAWLPLYNLGQSGDVFSLVVVHADDPQLQVVTLVDPLTHKAIRPSLARTASNGTVLLEAANTIYTLRDGKLQEQRYIVKPENENELPWIKDFTLADDGSLYVLADNTVKKITLDGKQTSTQLPVISDGWEGSYNSLEVDAHERLWLTAYIDAIGVFQPEWDGIARQVVIYDNYNSNYQYSLNVKPFRTSDGRIWAANTHLVWIDSNAAELPTPLPDWIAQIRRPNLIMPAVLFIVSILMAVVSLKSRFRGKNKKQPVL